MAGDLVRGMVSCCCPTYGRFSLLREMLWCYMHQTYTNRELVIVSEHPTPIWCEIPGVRYVHIDAKLHPTLGHIRNALIYAARGEYMAWFDDDDINLPWHLEQALANMNGAQVWKPKYSYADYENGTPALAQNNFESSWVMRTAWAVEHPCDYTPLANALPTWQDAAVIGAARVSDVPPSLWYRWANIKNHICWFQHSSDPVEKVRAARCDDGGGALLTPSKPDLSPLIKAFPELSRSLDAELP